jgi:hypothetical protein
MKMRQQLKRHLRFSLIFFLDSFVLDYHLETSSKQRQRHAYHDELNRFSFFSYSSSQKESSDDEDENDEDENDEDENDEDENDESESDEDDEMISRESDFKNQNNSDKYIDLRFSLRLVINFSTLIRCI